MSNNTTNENNYWQFQMVYIVWITEFLFIGLGNALIAFAIIRYEAIRDRKEYLIIFGLCLADFLSLTSYFCAGSTRFLLCICRAMWTIEYSTVVLTLPVC